MTLHKYITVAYKMYASESDTEFKDEELMEECDAKHPFVFISGLGLTLPAFEAGVVDKAKGDEFNFVIPSKDAYGDFCDELMFDVERSVFEIDGKIDSKYIYEGAVVPMKNEEGNMFNATVIEIKEKTITIDLNHPHAGEDLHFVGTVVESREATNEEIADMLSSLGGGCCSGGCGGCGGHCGEGDCSKGDCDGGCNCCK